MANDNGAPNGEREKLVKRWQGAYSVVYFVGGLSVVLSVVALLGVEFLQNLGFGGFTLLAGMIYLVLAYFVHKKKSFAALAIAFGLYLLDSIVGIAASIEAGGRPTAGIAVRIVFAFYMFQGFGAIRQLKSSR